MKLNEKEMNVGSYTFVKVCNLTHLTITGFHVPFYFITSCDLIFGILHSKIAAGINVLKYLIIFPLYFSNP